MQVMISELPNAMPVERQTWGSEANNLNAMYVYMEHPKPRWQEIATGYKDIAALARFGIDPLRPPGGGIIMHADSYGYPIEGYTTGYTTKLPPPANFLIASHTPLSGNVPAIVEASDGTNAVPSIPSDDPVQFINMWRYGDEGQQKRLDEIRRAQARSNIQRQAGGRGTDERVRPQVNPVVAPMHHPSGVGGQSVGVQAQPYYARGPYIF